MMLSFHGAAGGVTGSCFLLEVGGRRVLIDCGLYQGRREIVDENREPFGFDPQGIDWLLLTHAHLDHCGRIPLLVKEGFRGEIIATAATRELARLVLLDAAHLQEEDARVAERRARRRGRPPPGPLYTVADALWSFDRFGRSAVYGERIELADGLAVTFADAGHILGSATLTIDARDEGGARRIVFSGDLGGVGHPILRDPSPPPHADYVVMESTYGDRVHRSLDDSVEELWAAIGATLKAGGNSIIPTFALERTQEILYFLREGVERGRLPQTLAVFLDSPMAISATEIMRRHPECYDDDTRRAFAGGDPFDLPGLRYTREASDSMALDRITGGAVIIAGSGMCTGGRVRFHLRSHLWREASSVIFVGFAAEGTLARQIIDGAKEVRIFGEPVRVRARIHTINGFSAHADRSELIAWHAASGAPQLTFLVHGEPDRGMQALATALEAGGHKVSMPVRGAAFALAPGTQGE
ncbi:MAG TPA: MBL fold metallo-hydrolase [Casimicrobiaceae bacterium]